MTNKAGITTIADDDFLDTETGDTLKAFIKRYDIIIERDLFSGWFAHDRNCVWQSHTETELHNLYIFIILNIPSIVKALT